MTTVLPELAVKRYTEFIESFNKFKLVEYQIDVKSFDVNEKILTFYNKIASDEKLFKYLLNKDKLLFHKNYKLSLMPKINLYNLIDSNIDASLISFVWETVQMLYLIIADGQNELTKKQAEIQADLKKLEEVLK